MEIIFEDASIIVCYKPAGLPTQTKSVGQEDLETELKKYRASKGESPEIFIVHRLDQPVEGLVVVAKTKNAAASLSAQVQQHIFGKRYYAVVTGTLTPEKGEMIDFLAKDQKNNLTKVSNEKDKNAKKAILNYEIVDKWDNKSLVQIELLTGRHHQIRVQLSSRKTPIVGDLKYGGDKSVGGLSLCSYYLGFEHPKTKKKMEFEINPKGAEFQSSKLF